MSDEESLMMQTPPSTEDGGLIHIKNSQRSHILKRVMDEVCNISNYNLYSIHELEVKLSLLERHLETFEKVQSQLESLDESQLGKDHRLEFEDGYFKLKSYILERLSTLKNHYNAPSLTSTNFGTTIWQQASKPNLPTLQLTKFSGNYNDWTEFYNMFCILVHENSDLTPVSKFQYLRSCLTDNASRLIQSLDITPENYNQALEILKSRYDNKRLIFQSHIEKIFNIKEFSKPNVTAVRDVIDSVNVNLRALQSIASKGQISDGILLYMLQSKLDPETQSKWEEEMVTNWGNDDSSQSLSIPTWNDLSSFLEKRCKTLEIVNKTQPSRANVSHGRSINYNQSSSTKNRPISSFVATKQSTTTMCPFCKNTPQHNFFHCIKFNEMPTAERFRAVKKLKLCINCLGSNHIASMCPSSHRCQQCKAAHHTLLHKDDTHQQPFPDNSQPTTSASNAAESPCSLQISEENSHVILGTARVELKVPNGRYIVVRALLDSGSQLHFITEKIAHFLHVSRNKVNVEITGIACNSYNAFSNCTLTINSLTNNYSALITAVVIPSITSYQPQSYLNINDFNIPGNIELADPHFNMPGPVDPLIGAGLFYELLMVGQIKFKNMSILQKTTLGWIVTGKAALRPSLPTKTNQQFNKVSTSCILPSPHSIRKTVDNQQPNKNEVATSSSFNFNCLITNINTSYNALKYSNEPSLEKILEQFWKIEEPTRDTIRTTEEEECEKFFQKTTTRCPHTNKFIVRLPFKRNPLELGSSTEIAKNRFHSLEKRLAANESIRMEYSDFMQEYIGLKHMEKALPSLNSSFNYIPHHCVLKPESSTTRLRVVFDGSCRTSSGLSLNNILIVGPTLQEDLFSILFRFRFHKFVLVADIAKMYRQVLVNENDVHWQSIIWRDKINDPLSTYVLKTVTYGTSSAPYLAVKCLQVLAIEGASAYPVGSRVTLRDFFVDNLMTGGKSINDVIEIRRQVTELLRGGGFPLRKFASNCEKILDDVPNSERETVIKVDDSEYIKTLGLKWLPQEDSFSYLYNQCGVVNKTTKRTILSHTAKLFDPLGLINPFIVRCKILLQRIWSLNLHWDESVPQDILMEWAEIQNQLKKSTTIRLPRYVIFNDFTNIHAFADASTKAYGACVYAVTWSNNNRFSSLLCSKSRVAPQKLVSLPRLELCAAVLLSQLLKSVLNILPQPPQKITCWSDSTITLCWIAGDSSRWKPFVKNRVEKIKANITTCNWRHVPSHLNPADILSRGASIHTLTDNKLWFNGPEFLSQDDSCWPDKNYIDTGEANCELRQVSLTAAKASPTMEKDFLQNHKFINNYEKLLRIFVYVARFAFSIIRKEIPKTDPINCEEMNQSLEIICRLIQGQFFRREIHRLKLNQPIDSQSKLLTLSPFLHNGLLSVGGRLNKSSLPFSVKHPILLPPTHKFVHTIIRHHHHKNLHAGVQTLNNILRDSLWIIKAKQTIKHVIHYCVFCYRFRPITEHQVMGTLPTERVSQSHPFAVSGVDYCGPFHISQQLRGRPPIKVYVAVFICFSIKAVHLELVPDLTTNAFIAALKRFIARSGRCSTIFSDNATNFIGANRELKDMLQHFLSEQHQTKVADSCRHEGKDWRFIPPRSPHFGGLWESAVKQAKHYLRRSIGLHTLTFDELHTVCCQAEAIINSRPLTPLSNDPNDLRPLTPAHFLIGRPLTTILEPSTINVNAASLKRYHITKWIQQEFWDRWRSEYLKSLQQRTKWHTVELNLNPGDLVLLKEDSTPPLKWPLGRVLETFPGNDGLVRVVSVKTNDGIFKRAITKLCKLPIEQEQNNSVESKASNGGGC